MRTSRTPESITVTKADVARAGDFTAPIELDGYGGRWWIVSFDGFQPFATTCSALAYQEDAPPPPDNPMSTAPFLAMDA